MLPLHFPNNCDSCVNINSTWAKISHTSEVHQDLPKFFPEEPE